MKAFYTVAFIALLLSYGGFVEGATRYVSTSGSDSNSCATSTVSGVFAKRNLNGSSGAIACMSGGDVLIVQDGIYNEQISDTGDHAPGTTAPPSGTSWSAPTVIKAENFRGATLNKPAADAEFELVVNLALVSTQYVSIEDFVLDGRTLGASCVWVGPANHIQIKGNKIENCAGNGIFQSVDSEDNNGNDARIVNNEIRNFAIWTPDPGTHGIYFTGHDGLIQGNFIYECPFFGIQASSEHGGLNNNVIENNRVYGCKTGGIISQGSNSIVRNNLLENNCIGIWAHGTATKIYNNTIFDSAEGGNCNTDSYGILNLGGTLDIRNNLILQQGGIYIYTEVSPTLEGNLCDGAAQNCQLTTSDYTTVVVDGILSASTTPVASNLQLKSGSAAINVGSAIASDVPLDRLGVSRPQGSQVDVGAYEFVAGGDTTPPVVSITSPLEGATVSGVISVTATASDNVAVVSVQFKVGGANIGAADTSEPYSVSLNTALIGNGTHSLTAVATDGVNSTTSTAVSITVNNTDTVPPSVSVTAPLNGATVSGTVTMSAIASDDVGVIDVQFKVDGGNVGTPDVGPSYDRPWDTTGYSDGVHSVTAVARDAVNSTTSAVVTVTVDNGVPAPSGVAKVRRVYQW